MQRKGTFQSQASVTEMHFAVVPYELQYLVPNDQIYQIYFQKGLQILGTTQYPIENHQKLKRIQLPILNNIIPFRLFSEKNSQYQWTIYKRVSDMEEFLESKKINLKDILKKQPLKRLQNQKKNQTQRKDSMNNRRTDTKNSEIKGITSKASEFKPSQSKGNQLKSTDAVQKISEVSVEGNSLLNKGKGCIFEEQVKSDLGHFILKFYLFRGFSNQELSKAIQQKSRQKRLPFSEISVNKVSELPKISQIESKNQQIKEQNIQIYPTLQQDSKFQQGKIEVEKEQVKQQPVQTTPNEIQTAQEKAQQKAQQKSQQRVEQKVQVQQIQQEQKPVLLEGSTKEIGESPIHAENFAEQQTPVTQVPQFSQEIGVEPVVVQTKAPFVFSMRKKMFVVGVLLMILLYVLYSLNLFDNISIPETITVPKKQKKEKFSNRKKISK